MPADLARQRVKAARDIYVQMNARYEAGNIAPESLLTASLQLLQAELAATGQGDSVRIAELAWRMAWRAD